MVQYISIMAKRGSREKVEKCVIEYAKKLDPATLQEAHAWYCMEIGQWCYNNVSHVGVMFPEQLDTVQAIKGGNVLIVLPVCATRYMYYRRIPIESPRHHIASTYV